MDGVPVYDARLAMGQKLGQRILEKFPDHGIDCVIPIPDTSRTSALQLAYTLDVPYREGFIKNRYIARTFIMPGQAARQKTIRLKLNTLKTCFAGKNVLLVDDSIVRGTTATQIVQMAREAGAKNVYMCSAAPAVRYPNVYGIDIPTSTELIANGRTEEEIASLIGADWLMYQSLADLEASISESQPVEGRIKGYDSSCFNGIYNEGDISAEYLASLHEVSYSCWCDSCCGS